MVIGSESEILTQVSIGLLLGFGFGLIQEIRGRFGAMKMYALLTAGVSLFTILSFVILEAFGAHYNVTAWNVDPTHILQALFVGVAIVAAGFVFKSEDLGLDAVSLFSSMVIMSGAGVAVGLGKYFLALIVMAMAILATEVARFIEDNILS